MWNQITQFFKSLFSSSNKSNVISDLQGWATANQFEYEAQTKTLMHKDYDHLVFFQHGDNHQTQALMRHRTPDLSTIVSNITLEHEGVSASYVCYLFENTTISLPKLQLANRDSALFTAMRGSVLSPISMPSDLSNTHSALCEKAQWGDRMLGDNEIKSILTSMDAESLRWLETDDCHILIVCQNFHPEVIRLGKMLFHHFAQYRYRKANS